jgi:hypothetical protein
VGKQRHRVDAVRQRAHVRTSRARGERARLERVRHVADEDGDGSGWQHRAVEELGREPEDGATEGVDQQQLNEIVEGETEEPVDVPADDPTHTQMLLFRTGSTKRWPFVKFARESLATPVASVDVGY